ncbi:MAG: aspartate aminotransferase family protein [Verrucomicrobiota bacterium]|nr:aspartate aminotransferase family protein [Verrucomicrobiota bacterium]
MTTQELYDKYMITSMVAGFEPVVVDRASGCAYIEPDGKQYLDCFAGIAVCNAGHGHPRVVAAAKAQIDKLIHCCTYVYYSPKAAELAKLLAEATPGALQKSFLANSGAEAIEGALRLAKQFTKRREIVALSQGFHGRSYAALSVTGNWARKKGAGPYMPGVAFAPAPDCYRCPFGHSGPAKCGMACAKHMDYVIKYNTSADVAAFIAEPILGEGGIIVPPDGYFKTIKRVLDAHKALFICDEAQSGFGRTGKFFAIEHYGVEPEIMTMAKGIADGFPLAAFIAREDVAGAFTPGDHLSTFGGSPVSCAAAIANIGVMKDEKIPDAAERRGREILARLKEFQKSCKLVGDVRGKGLMIGVELVKDAAKTPAAAEAKAVRKACRESGVLFGLGGSLANVIRIQPPLTISAKEADLAMDVLEKALAEKAVEKLA